MNETYKTLIAKVVRHLLTAGATLLVGKGVLDTVDAGQLSSASDLIAGVIVGGANVAWFWWAQRSKKPTIPVTAPDTTHAP